MEWFRIGVAVRPEYDDPAGVSAAADLALAGLPGCRVRVERVYWLMGARDGERLARTLFIDPVLEEPARAGEGVAVSVWKKTGVMDPTEASIKRAARALGDPVERAVTATTYWIESDAEKATILAAVGDSLANEVIEEMGLGAAPAPKALPQARDTHEVAIVSLDGLDDDALVALSKKLMLALDVTEMQAVRDHFAALGRAPRLGELETIAQTWSEHCKHKTLTGPIDYVEDGKAERIGNLLKETVFASTVKLDRDWCVSVFKDNAGIVRFDDENDICFKVETHNHPSAIEPYGGAGTGIGGVIRDILGTGLGAKPVANTDVFCFGDLNAERLPKGVLHPMRVMKGVVAGVRDYGNRMGIPTVNGAVCFDERYRRQPDRVLRHRRRHPAARHGGEGGAARRQDRRVRRPHRARRHPRRDVLQRDAARRVRHGEQRRGADRQPDRREARARRAPAGARPRALHRRHRLRRRRILVRGRRDG